MQQYDRAGEVVLEAVVLCDKHPEALRYRETAFDIMYFLGRIRVMAGEYMLAEEAFNDAESRVGGTYFEFKSPLCPEVVRVKAEQKRWMGRTITPDEAYELLSSHLGFSPKLSIATEHEYVYGFRLRPSELWYVVKANGKVISNEDEDLQEEWVPVGIGRTVSIYEQKG